MIACLISVLFAAGAALAQGVDTQAACNIDSEFKGTKHPRLDRLKATVANNRINCSAAFVTFKGRSGSAAGLVLGAGHCSGMGKLRIKLSTMTLTTPDAGEVLYRVSDRQTLTLDTGNGEAPRTCVESDEIIYGTMTDADLVLLRLVETYDQIERRTGVKPFLISQDAEFPTGLDVRIPSSLFQDDRECRVDTAVERLKEHRWLWGPVLRLRLSPDCDIPHGLSGAPVLRVDTNEVIGVVGTGSDANAAPCELNNPCEIGKDGSTIAAKAKQGYAHFVHKFYTCLDAARNLDLGTPGCLLAKPQP